ncbi:MAG: hypothetical protein ACYDHM_03420 [Acidiferrobacterales bacterium]
MSIFYKDCPQCAATHAASAIRCSCGHFFVPESEAGPDLSPELRAQEEKLYVAYLAARRDQTAEAVETARAEASMAPGNARAAQLLAEAEVALKAAETELDIQIKKSLEARKSAEAAAAASSQTAREIAASASPSPDSPEAPVSQPDQSAIRTSGVQARSAHAAAATKNRNERTSSIYAKPVAFRIGANAETRAQVKAQKAARAALARARAEGLARSEADVQERKRTQNEEALKLARAETEQSAQAAHTEADVQKAERKTEETPAQLMPEPTQFSREKLAEKAFRANQAVKAGHALAAAKVEQQAAQSGSGAAFRAAQAARAAQIVASVQVTDTKECPSCTATVALLATACRCGFTFPAGSTELPVLALSAVELAELFGTPRT